MNILQSVANNPNMEASNALRQPPMLVHHAHQKQQQMLNVEHSSNIIRGEQQQFHNFPPTMSSEQEASSFRDTESNNSARAFISSPQYQQQQLAAANSPWHRMKWNDDMVRLLIQVVYHVGDEADVELQSTQGKKKVSGAFSALLQKKGKWKSVSQALVEKGFYVSPQQCEDKFNDLNKRYKRVNELLGRGIACKVVENHALLDTMDHLTPKAKDEARKLLNSKHLFFPEMCAYHNAGHSSCSAVMQAPLDYEKPLPVSVEAVKPVIVKEGNSSDDDEDSSEYDDYEEDYDEDGEDDLILKEEERKMIIKTEEDSKLINPKKRKTTNDWTSSASPPPVSPTVSSVNIQQFKSELTGLEGSVEQQRQWLKRKAFELEEQRVGYHCKALQLEKQMIKWLRFSANKERELQSLKLDNDRQRVDNDRMLLLMRQKLIELRAQQKDCHRPS